MELVLKSNNLYRNGTVGLFTTGEGILNRELVSFKGTEQDEYHIVRQEDRIDLIANKFYSKRVADASKFWWVIADANDIENPLDLSSIVGSRILIPNILNVLLELQE